MNVMLGEKVILRLKSLLVFTFLIAGIIAGHADKLPFNTTINNTIEWVCIILTSLNNSVVGMYSERRPNESSASPNSNS